MSEETSVATGNEGTLAPVVSNALGADAPETLTPNQAAKALAELRWKRNQEPPAESAPVATAAPELAEQANAAPPSEATGETQEDAPAETPPRELPRSWTKDRAEVWNRLDPAAQDILLEQDRKASAEVRRLQNEAAEERKAIKAEREAAEKVRQEYETKLPALSKSLESALQSEFADIKSFDDVRRMQAEDPFRYQQWDLRQKEIAVVKQEEQALQQRQANQRMTKRAEYESEQNKLLLELVPDMADPKKSVELRERAVTLLTDDLGMRRDQLERWMADDVGHEILSNAGFQKLVADGLKYRDLLNAPKVVAKPDLPPVQRPGTAKPAGSAVSERLQALDSKLSNSGSLKDAQALLLAKRNAQRRAS
jgi:hypothetical protein